MVENRPTIEHFMSWEGACMINMVFCNCWAGMHIREFESRKRLMIK